jgi:hypothetical protein
MPPRRNQVSQEVTDISAASQLLRYAAAGQLEVLCSRRGLTHGAVAQGAGFGTTVTSAGPALTKALGDRLTPRQLNGLDEVIGALVPDLDGTGGLCSLALRLSAESRREMKGSSLTARVPPSWTAEILGGQPADELGVLIQASALLSEFIAADKIKTSAPLASIRDRYSREAHPDLGHASDVPDLRRADLAGHAGQLRVQPAERPPGIPAARLADVLSGMASD